MSRKRPNQTFRRGRCRSLCLCLSWLLFLGFGCAGNLARYRPAPFEALPVQRVLDTVPFFPQEDFQCGPAALAMTLAWSGVAVTPQDLTSAVYTPAVKGSLQPAMIAAARRSGRIAYPISSPEELIREIAAGHPVVVLQNLGLSWAPVWHYAVVIGYDLDVGIVVLHSGMEPRRKTPLRVFNRTWSRSEFWGMLTLSPDRIPAGASENAYVTAVAGLEKAGRHQAAIAGYQTARQRWPESLSAAIGLGNAYYAAGNLAEAERALRESAGRFPDAGVVFNNLAQVLWERGKREEARQAARSAVRLGGPMLPVFQKTLDDIQAGTGDDSPSPAGSGDE